MARGDRGKQAYRRVDISCIPDEALPEILSDVEAGGKEFGLQIVETVHNGPAVAPIYGVYNFDEERWAETQSEFGFEEELNEDNEEALTKAAQAKAEREAEEARKKEEEEIAAITGEKGDKPDAAKLAQDLKDKNDNKHKR